MSWRSVLKQYRVSRGSFISTLVLINLVLALYTIPALLGNRSKSLNADASASPENYLLVKRRLEGPPEGRPEMRLEGRLRGYSERPNGTKIDQVRYLMEPTEGCLEDRPFLLLAVCSAVSHFDLRQAIRETWASAVRRHRISTRIVFVLGAPSGEFAHLQRHVTAEGARYGDVVQGDFRDSHVDLTTKTLFAMRWSLTFCPSVAYFMKADDDVFVNVGNLVGVLLDSTSSSTSTSGRGRASRPFMLGHVIRNARPIGDRYSKWYTPTSMLDGAAVYPDYLSGSAYVVSGGALAAVYRAATSRAPFWLEDVYITGVISRELNIPLVHEPKFTFRKPRMFHPCLFRILVTAHQISAADMRDIWLRLHSADLDCSGYLKRRATVDLLAS